MTSFGDVFSQPYTAIRVDQPTLPDKTCSAGLGCESVNISPEYVAATQCWLEAAEQQMLPVISDAAYDAQPLMKRKGKLYRNLFPLMVLLYRVTEMLVCLYGV